MIDLECCGDIEFDGKPQGLELPHERQQLGIATVYQEFTLMPNLSVAENIFIGRQAGEGQFPETRQILSGIFTYYNRDPKHIRDILEYGGALSAPRRRFLRQL
jgi:ABC-type sugar transport system ATPase subunit